MDFSKYMKPEFEGEIIEVNEGVLGDFKEPEVIAQWENADAKDPYIEVCVAYENTVVRQTFKVVSVRGFSKSNLKKFIDKNNLPGETESWVGKPALLRVKGNYLNVAL